MSSVAASSTSLTPKHIQSEVRGNERMKSQIRRGVLCVETEYTDLSGLPRKCNIPAPCRTTATHAMAHSLNVTETDHIGQMH
jgi:hypothetical protein